MSTMLAAGVYLPAAAVPRRCQAVDTTAAWPDGVRPQFGGRLAKIGVLIHKPLCKLLFCAQDRARLQRLGEVVWTESESPIATDAAIALLRDADVAIGSWKAPVPDERLLAACPKLRLWEHAAGSVKTLFGLHLRGRNLVIASCAPALAQQVAEFTLGLMIVGLKRVFTNASDNKVRPVAKPSNAKSLSQASIGIIAASQSGRRVIELLRPLGAKILLYDPHVSESQAAQLGATKVKDLVELCASSDLISMHAPLLPTTRKMLAAPHFTAMRDDAIFINTARGGCIDEAALIAQLEKGRLFAFLDVTDPEPALPDSPLRKLPNVVLTSHIAGMAEFHIGRQAVDDVEAFLAGRSPQFVVTEEMLDRMA